MNQNTDSFAAAFDTAVRLLARRAHTRYEIVCKLRQRKFSATDIDAVIAECEQRRYLDDEAAAGIYFRELVRKGFGAERIRFEMKKKGLSGERVEALLTAYAGSPDEMATAEKLFAKRMASFDRESDPTKRKGKIFRFMYSRGFSAELVRNLLDKLRTKTEK